MKGSRTSACCNLGPEITLVQEGELALYTKGGQEALRPSQAHWLPENTTHLARNEGGRPTRFWSVLLKRCD